MGGSESNTAVFSLVIFKCGCSICRILVGGSFSVPRGTVFRICTSRRGLLFLHYFSKLLQIYSSETCWAFVRIVFREIAWIVRAVTQSLQNREERTQLSTLHSLSGSLSCRLLSYVLWTGWFPRSPLTLKCLEVSELPGYKHNLVQSLK